MILHIYLMLLMLSELPGSDGKLMLMLDKTAKRDPQLNEWYADMKCGPFLTTLFGSPRLTFTADDGEQTVSMLTDFRNSFYMHRVTQPGLYECSTERTFTPDGIQGPFQANLSLTAVTLKLLFLDARLTDLDTKQTELSETSIGFFARPYWYKTYEPGDVVQFGVVLTNNGDAFDNDTSIFTAPISGTYVFHLTIMGQSIDDFTIILASLMRDEDHVAAILSLIRPDPLDQNSNQAVLALTKGQTIWVKNVFGSIEYFPQFSFFSGALLFASIA